MLEGLVAEVDRLAELNARDLADADLHEAVVALHRETTRLAAVLARLVGAWDQRRVWADDGSKSAAARLRREC